MTKKERAIVAELSALGGAGLLLAFAVPTLISTRDSVVAVCGGLLVLGYLSWLAYFVYRNRNGGK